MSSSSDQSFSKGLGILAGIAGLFLGISAASENPESNIFIGMVVGFGMGYVIGWVVGQFLTALFKFLLAVICGIIILIRFYNIISFLFD